MDRAELEVWARTHKAWEQIPDEPDRWYGRFQLYLELGSRRTLLAAIRREHELEHKQTSLTTGKWYHYARVWRWRERATEWDTRQRELLALSERNARLTLRHRRIDRFEDYLDSICEALDVADIANVNKEQARAWLPQLRVFFRDLMVAERQEFEHSDDGDGLPAELTITADDLSAAQRLLDAQPPIAGAKDWLPLVTPQAKIEGPMENRTLLVCVGAEEGLMLDLAVLRAVRTATGLEFQRVLNTTKRKLADQLRRARNFGRPYELLHIALHASAAGIEFADGMADGNWLSERLAGVRVMLLASCECDTIGDWLGVVPYVVTLSEEISHEDASALTQAFWHNIGLRQEPGAALNAALAHCPPAVSEYVVRHW
jgi:hypothetical protein